MTLGCLMDESISQYSKVEQYWVYILSNKRHGTIYIGFTGDIKMRTYQHKIKEFTGFTDKYNLDKLVYFESFEDPNEAIAREKELKKWRRNWKIDLIESMNPYWKDLSEGWYKFEKSRGYIK